VNELWVVSTSGCISAFCMDARQNMDNTSRAASASTATASHVSVTTRFSASFAFPAVPSGMFIPNRIPPNQKPGTNQVLGIFGVESTRLRGECTHVILSLVNGLGEKNDDKYDDDKDDNDSYDKDDDHNHNDE
jgi:hypothetical protein